MPLLKSIFKVWRSVLILHFASLLLLIFVYNTLVIVVAGFTLFLLRNALVTKHDVTTFTAK